MAKYITELKVSLNAAEEQMFQSDGFDKINVNLNKGAITLTQKAIYLWYKRGAEPITKVQVCFNEEMTKGLTKAGFTKIYKDLNAGAKGSPLYLWFFKGSGEFNTPIVDITVTAEGENEAAKFAYGWERVACDLNRGNKGKLIYIWLKREEQTYICDLTATDSYANDSDLFQNGYIRMDEDTNRCSKAANLVFIWYRQTTDPETALKEIQVSITADQYLNYQQQNYQQVVVNLDEGTKGQKVYMWYKKEESSQPIKAIALLLNTALVKEYQKAGLNVIEKNVSAGNKVTGYLCVYP